MFEKIIKQAKDNGLTAFEKIFCSGHYYDGKEQGYDYPVIVFTCDRETDGNTIATWLYDVEKIVKRHKLIKRDSRFLPGHYYMAYTTKAVNNTIVYLSDMASEEQLYNIDTDPQGIKAIIVQCYNMDITKG